MKDRVRDAGAASLIAGLLVADEVLLLVVDDDGRIELFNRGCELASGLQAGSVVGRRLLDSVQLPRSDRSGTGPDRVDGTPGSPIGATWVDRCGRAFDVDWKLVVHDRDDRWIAIGTQPGAMQPASR